MKYKTKENYQLITNKKKQMKVVEINIPNRTIRMDHR